jgi:spermidine synthase
LNERLQGHIPLLLHPQPQRIAFLGLGTAISLSAIRFHPIREALALELVPEVADAARTWFGDANLDLADPRVRSWRVRSCTCACSAAKRSRSSAGR